MKVYIGPYRNYFGPYQAADLLMHVGVSEDRCHRIGHYLSETLLGDLLNRIHSWKKRKVKIRIDKYDSWNADDTLAMIILPVLKQLRDTTHGSSGSMPAFSQISTNLSQLTFPFYAEWDDIASDAGHKEWKEILDKMIWSFEQFIDDSWQDQYWIQKPIIDMEEYDEDKGFDITKLRWKQEGICDWEGMRKHEEKINEGLELFGKHYRDLWD